MNSLLVGVGISDRAAPGDDPVADASTAEALGYDFVSAFDHPVADAATARALGYGVVSAVGHPARTYPTYETQTLLTWIAARTTPGTIAGSAADITDQLHSLTELGFPGFDLLPPRHQIRATAEDILPALRELRVSGTQRVPKAAAAPARAAT